MEKLSSSIVGGITIVLIAIIGCFPVLGSSLQGPKLFMEESQFDFGNVKQGKVLEHTFMVMNQGDQPLVIKKVKPG